MCIFRQWSLAGTDDNNQIRQVNAVYMQHVEDKLMNAPSFFYSFINGKKVSRNTSVTKTHNGLSYSSPQEICELFASYFTSIYASVKNREVRAPLNYVTPNSNVVKIHPVR